MVVLVDSGFNSIEESDEDDKSQLSDDDASDNEEEHKPLPSTVVFIAAWNKKQERNEIFRVLLDTGTNRCMATQAAARRAGLKINQGQKHTYHTAAGTFQTTKVSRLRSHRILELNSRRMLRNLKVQVTDGDLGAYDFIFGRDYLNRYGIDLIFSEKVIQWDGVRMNMKIPEDLNQDFKRLNDELQAEIDEPCDPCSVIEEAEQALGESYAQQILDSKYEKQDLLQVSRDQKHLTREQQESLHVLFQQYEDLFQGTLGEWPDEEVSIELNKNAEPYHCGKPIRIPHIHLETLQKEVNRLVELGVLEVVEGKKAGPWCAPSFIIPKKDGRVRFITDYRQLNQRMRRKPWPMPHIADLLQDIGSYKYVTALDLSMAYYHLRLDDEASDLSTFVLPFGLYKYRRLPMGLCLSVDIFQEKMAQLFADTPYIKVYLDDLLVLSNGTYEDHLEKVKLALERLHSKNLQVNPLKSYWAVKEVDYLGFRLTPDGVQPQPKKVAAIMNMEAPKNKRQLRHFIGLVNYYRYMWRKRSHILAPLSALVSKLKKFHWGPEQHAAFEEIKLLVAQKVLLSFPDYSQGFQLYLDASDRQLGAVLKQGDKTLAFFSKKLNKAQLNYGVGEKEFLSLVEALKEFRTMIYGYKVDVYTDHLNWAHDKSFRNARVMRWRLLVQEYAPTIHYVKGEKNIVADALSRLPTTGEPADEDDAFAMVAEAFDMSRQEWRKFYQPLTIKEIGKAQAKDKYLATLRRQAPDRLGEWFEDIGKKAGPDRVTTVTDPADKSASRIVVPASLTRRLMEYYHHTLVHPGVHRLYNTLRQHYTWPKMLPQIRAYLKHCRACQIGKRGVRGMGKIPIKDVETEPWKDVALDLSGPWKATVDNKIVIFHTFTIIDVFTGWVEIIPITTKKSEVIRDLFVQEWLRRYPRPSRVIFDSGGEFDNDEFHATCTTWYVKPEPITVKNPRANAIVERMHKVLGDMLRVQIASRHGQENPVRDLTSAAAYGIRATVHGVTQCTPAQLVYSKDMILRTRMIADVELVRQRREAAIRINNARENKRRITYNYKKGDYVLILSGGLDPKLQLHRGPYKVLSYDKASGTLHIMRNHYVEPINVRLVRPFYGDPKAKAKH